MKSTHINYLVVGSFVLVALVGFVIGIATLTGRTGGTETYYSIYNNVTGIKVGTRVLYEGFHVGQVETIEPKPKQGRMQFRVDFSVREGWKIPENSVMQISISGLLAAASLSITAGDSPTSLKPGTQLKGKEQGNIFAAISSVAEDMRELSETSLKPLLGTVNKAVGTMGTLLEKDGKVLIRDIGTLARDLSERTPQIVDNVEDFTVRMKNMSDQLNGMIGRVNKLKFEGVVAKMDTAAGNFVDLSNTLDKSQAKLDGLLSNMSGTVGNVNSLVGDINTTVRDNKLDIEKTIIDMRYVMDSLARHIDSVNQNMEEAARNMKEFSRQIRQNPGLLLSGARPEESAK
ncbi:MAG: MCE family protein [Rhodospirillales bacterium]|nr:MCE family protein [Rhodospirillales bacterium]